MPDPSQYPAAPPADTPLQGDALQTANCQIIAVEALPEMLATLVSLHNTRNPLAVALDTVDREIARVTILAHQAMHAIGARNFATADATFELQAKTVYKPTDWQALQAHIVANPIDFDLIQRRLSSTALQQRTELPPGVMRDTFDVPKFSLAKVAR